MAYKPILTQQPIANHKTKADAPSRLPLTAFTRTAEPQALAVCTKRSPNTTVQFLVTRELVTRLCRLANLPVHPAWLLEATAGEWDWMRHSILVTVLPERIGRDLVGRRPQIPMT
ncbi:hypothetical protein PENANT_c257G08654, partial [Penicillium antarcticum]